MPSAAFQESKKEGRWFEGLMRAEVMKMAEDPTSLYYQRIHVIDTDKLKYRQKKGNDFLVRLELERTHVCKVECKLDKASRTTDRVYIDLDSIDKSDSPIWIFGLPEDEEVRVSYQGHRFLVGRTIKTYVMFLQDLAPFALAWPYRYKGGEFKQDNPAPPKATFISQPFIRPFKIIQMN